MSPLTRSIFTSMLSMSFVNRPTSFTVSVFPSLEMTRSPFGPHTERFSGSSTSIKRVPVIDTKKSSVFESRMSKSPTSARLSGDCCAIARSPDSRRFVRKMLLNLVSTFMFRSRFANSRMSRSSNLRMELLGSSKEPNSGAEVSAARATQTTRKLHASAYAL
ncbi:PP228 [Orf virus]|uniref:PP228 n=1 Tax=Orf virus TaxID=10258 RepID=F1AXA3_ORFV|nr:PP228 [Orf virus]